MRQKTICDVQHTAVSQSAYGKEIFTLGEVREYFSIMPRFRFKKVLREGSLPNIFNIFMQGPSPSEGSINSFMHS